MAGRAKSAEDALLASPPARPATLILDRLAPVVKARLPEGARLISMALIEDGAGMLVLANVLLATGETVRLATRDLSRGLN